MPLDHWLTGRMERRLPIIVVVRLAHCAPAGADGQEKTFTDNISPRENDSPAIQGIPLLFGWDLAKMRGEGANKPR